MKPILVIWKDPRGLTGWFTEEEMKKENIGLCYRICFLFKEDEENYYLVAGSGNDSTYEDPNIIPKSNVISIIDIELTSIGYTIINEIKHNNPTLEKIKEILKEG
jgi:hypothetical protein